jgi:hypothetical protein
MNTCTFLDIENNFRTSDPAKADYLTDLTLNIWSELKESNQFRFKDEKAGKYLYASKPKTKKRQEQENYINNLNNLLGKDVIGIDNFFNTLKVKTKEILNIQTPVDFNIFPNSIQENKSKYLNKDISSVEDKEFKRDIQYFKGDEALFEQENNDLSDIRVAEDIKYEEENYIIDPLLAVTGKQLSLFDENISFTQIKPGVQELFDSNPELANQVYEALGFDKKDTNIKDLSFELIDSDSEHDYFKIFYKGKDLTTDSKVTTGKITLSLHNQGYIDAIEIPTELRNKGLGKSIYRKVNSELLNGKLKSDSLGRISKDAKKVWESLVKSGEAVKTTTGYEFKETQITPQQKQQALQAYSQYLDTGKQDVEGFKEFVNNDKINTNLKFNTNNLTIIDTEDIVSYEGTKGAAQYDRSNNIIKVNRKLLKQKFEEKAWTKPRKLMETLHGTVVESYAQALDENQFTTYEEWENFVIEHEFQHSLYSKADFNQEFPNKTKGDYETEINNRALNKINLTNKISIPTNEVTDNLFKENIFTDSGKIFSTISELDPKITDEKINEIYNNYVNLISITRPGKEIPKEIFKNLISQYQVFNYKNTYIFGTYDPEKAVFVTRVNSSPSSKELLAEALPALVEQGIDFISFVPEDVAKKYERSGYTISKNAFDYNFKGEDMLKYAAISNPNISNKIFNKDLNEITGKEFENYNNSLFLGYIPVEVNGELIKKAGLDISNILETYLNQFGIAVKDINLIKDKLKIDEAGFADILSKIAYVRDKKDLPIVAGEFIAYMMQYNPLVKSIINELIQTETFLLPKGLGSKDINGNWVYNYNKLNKDEYFKYIGQLISEDLQNKLEGNYSKSLVDKIKELIKQFFNYLTNTEINQINKNIGIISNNILQQNKRLITASLYKPGAYGKPTKQVSLKAAMEADKFGESIISRLSNKGFILTGSTSLGEQGTIQRPDENLLHDIDWVSPFSREETKDRFLQEYPEAIKIRDIYGDGYVTDTWIIAPENYKITNLVTESDFNIITSYSVVDNNNNVVGTYTLKKQNNSNQKEEIVTGIEAKVIDFFSYESYNQRDPLVKNNVRISNWKDIFKAKIEFARYKDIWDYNRFIPNENLPYLNIKTDLIPNSIEEQFAEAKKLENKNPENNEEFNKKILYSLLLPNISSDKFNKVFSQTDPKEFNKYRQEKVKKIINSFAEKFGISIETINNFQDRSIIVNNKTISYNGVANLANKTIKYLEGDDAALTEEVAHFLIAMLPKDSQEYSALKNYIQNTPEYQLYYDKYLEVYDNDVDKTEEEIMGKVLANSLLGNKEQVPLSLKSIIKQVLNFFKNLINPFYQQEFEKSLNNINHLFFTENFETLFDEANITFDELYSLDFLPATDVNVFKKSSQEIIDTVLQNLKRQRQKFIENKQANSVKKVDELIEILTNTDPEETTASKMKTYIEAAVIELERLQKAFAEFEASGVIYDLNQKDYKNLTKEEQEAQTQEDRMKHLNYIAAAVNTVQNLNAFIVLLEENFAVFNRDKDSLSKYREIISNLDITNPEANLFKTILNNTEINKISELKNIYNKLSKELLKVTFKSLNTKEQQKFLETVEKNETVPNTTDTANVKSDYSVLSTLTDMLKGKFNNNNFFKYVKQNLTPTSFQSDMFLLLVDNANASFRQIAMNATLKTIYEYDLLQADLNQLGIFDESWISAKTPNGKKSFKLLQKFNYKLFKGTLTNKIVNKHLKQITSFKGVLNEIKDNKKETLDNLFKNNFNSPRELESKIFQLYNDNLITDKLLRFLLNYTQALETGYTLRFLEPNANLSTNNRNILEQYRNEYIKQLTEKIKNLDFTKNKLPYLDPRFDFNSGVVSQDQFLNVAKSIVQIKRDKLIAKEVTVPQYVTDSKGNVNLNPVYESQMSYVEGLLNYFKQTIGYAENSEGDVQLNKFDILYFGDDFFFNLGDKGVVKDIEYIDPDYKKLENDLKSSNEKTKKIAETKLKILKKMQDQNLAENKPANFLPKVEKYDSSQYLSDSKEFRTYLEIFLKILPSALLGITLGTNPAYVGAIFFTSQIGINQLIKLAYYLHKGVGFKAFSLIFKSGFRQDLREEVNFNNKSFSNPVQSANIVARILQKINPKNWNNPNNPSSNIIDTNDFLLGESNIPKVFENKELADVEYSTDFLSDRKTYTQAVSNYKTSIRWESWIRMVGDFQARRTGFNSVEVINLIKDRFFYHKFYNSSKLTSITRWFVSNNSRRVLMGNLDSGITNLFLGTLNVLIHTDGSTLPKAFVQVLKESSQKLYDNSGFKPVFSDFVNLITGSDTSRNRLAVFTTLKDLYLGRNTSRFTNRVNVDTHISKYLKKNRGTGFTNFDESTNYLIQALNLTNTAAMQNLGEKIIEKTAINQYFLTNPLVDEFGKPIKNLKNYLKIVEGRIVLDKSKLNTDKLFLRTSLDTRLQSFIENGIEVIDNVSISNPTPLDLKLQPLTNLELDIFLNETISNSVNNLLEKSQGSYNIFTKSVWRNTFLGLLFLQFKDYLVTSLKSTVSSEKVYNDFTSNDMGLINMLSKYFSSVVTSGINKFRDPENKKELHADSYQNLLIVNNLRADIILKELNYFNYFLKESKNKKIDAKLKEIALDNLKYRQSIKTKDNVPYQTSLDTLMKITQFEYIDKYKNLNDNDKIKKIIENFNLNNNSKTFKEQQNFILTLLKQKFENNQSITKEQINKLQEYDINQNFIEIVQAYDKLKNNLTSDVKAINRLTNYITIAIALPLLSFLAFLMKRLLEEEEEEKDKITFFGWLSEWFKNTSMSLAASYFPLLELDSYGFVYSRGKSSYEYTKTAPALNDIMKIISSFYNAANWKAEAKKSIEKQEEYKYFLKIANRREQKLPFFKPILVKKDGIKTFETDPLLYETFASVFIPGLVSDNFKLYSNKKAQKRYEEIKDKSFIDLMYLKAVNIRFARFSDAGGNIESKLEREEKYEKKIKPLEEKNSEFSPFF